MKTVIFFVTRVKSLTAVNFPTYGPGPKVGTECGDRRFSPNYYERLR